jgi:hypothetical protein
MRMRRLWKTHPLTAGAPDYSLVAWLFLRLLAAIYLAAFLSLAVQITALAGGQGIYSIAEQLSVTAESNGAWRFLAYPSIFWIAASDGALLAAAYGGCVLAVLLFAGWWERPVLVLLYLLYLSLFHAGQIFTNFQWDYLLLEAGFLALFLSGGSRVVVWLYRWLLFRLRYYFETQPLPHAGAWYAHQLPEWLLRFGSGATLVVEILVPFLMFFPRRWRFLAAWVTILWQVLIILTSNHNFFNLLTIALCLFLFDDRALRRVLPPSWRRRAEARPILPAAPRRSVALATAVAAAVIVPASLLEALPMLGVHRPIPWMGAWVDWLEPYRIANRYHVFPTIESERLEVQISGTLDGKDWRPYLFRYWPVELDRIPPFVVPHQPRLDWMLWFVPSSPFFLDWLGRFLHRLLEASPPVLGLLADPPFGDQRPRMLRVDLYRYRFTTAQERAETGDWWHLEYLGPVYPLPLVERPP